MQSIDVDDYSETSKDSTMYDENKKELLKYAINDYINERLTQLSKEK